MPYSSMLAEPVVTCGNGFHQRCRFSVKQVLPTHHLRHGFPRIVGLMGDCSRLSQKILALLGLVKNSNLLLMLWPSRPPNPASCYATLSRNWMRRSSRRPQEAEPCKNITVYINYIFFFIQQPTVLHQLKNGIWWPRSVLTCFCFCFFVFTFLRRLADTSSAVGCCWLAFWSRLMVISMYHYHCVTFLLLNGHLRNPPCTPKLPCGIWPHKSFGTMQSLISKFKSHLWPFSRLNTEPVVAQRVANG